MAITTLVFDAYGTLFDIAAAARTAAEEQEFSQLSGIWPRLAVDWRDKQLQYSWLRAVSGAHSDFWHVTQDALDWALAAQGVSDAALRTRLLQLYRTLGTYPEVPAVLAELKSAGLTTAILSNGSADMLDDAVQSAGIAGDLDAVLSVDDVGIFKPANAVYDMVGARFGVEKSEVLFVSSNGWDAGCAAAYGFRTLWVNRLGVPQDRLHGLPDRVDPDLSGLPALVNTFLRNESDSAAQIGETQYFLNSDGLRLAYRDTGGDGPVLLCLAGLTRNLADFDFVARDFADRARVVRLDTRGRGQSDWDADYLNYSLMRESRDALALLDHLGLRKAAILGTSRGGLIAMSLAVAAKDRLSGVCLNDIGPEIEAEGLAFIGTYLGHRPRALSFDEAADNFVATTTGKFPGVHRDRWMLHARRIYSEAFDGLNLRYDAKLRNAIMEQSATDTIPDLWLLFDAMKDLPLALIRGQFSDILSKATAREMCTRRPDMIYAEVPDRGHVPFLDEPEAKDVIAAFLSRLKV